MGVRISLYRQGADDSSAPCLFLAATRCLSVGWQTETDEADGLQTFLTISTMVPSNLNNSVIGTFLYHPNLFAKFLFVFLFFCIFAAVQYKSIKIIITVR